MSGVELISDKEIIRDCVMREYLMGGEKEICEGKKRIQVAGEL